MVRQLQHGGPSSAAQPANPFDCFIVDAQEQDMSEAPTAVSMKMLRLLDSRFNTNDVVLPHARHGVLDLKVLLTGNRGVYRSLDSV